MKNHVNSVSFYGYEFIYLVFQLVKERLKCDVDQRIFVVFLKRYNNAAVSVFKFVRMIVGVGVGSGAY